MAGLEPVFRSDLVVDILRLLLVERGTWTADELSERTGAAYATVTRELRRLEAAEVVLVTVDGRTRSFVAHIAEPSVRALGRAIKLGTTPTGGDDMAKKKDKKKKGKKKK